MKRLSIIILTAIVLSSCAMEYQPGIVPRFDSIDDIEPWIRKHVTYKAEGDFSDHWQTPAETLELTTGDCEDYSVLWLYLVYESTQEKGELIISRVNDAGHASARCGPYEFYRNKHQIDRAILSYDIAILIANMGDL
jgi:hypothetical protein